MPTGSKEMKRVLALPATLVKAPMKVVFFVVGYIATWFFAGVAIQVAAFLAAN